MIYVKNLVERLCREKGYKRKDAQMVFSDVLDLLHTALLDGEAVNLKGIGTIYPAMSNRRRVWTNMTKSFIERGRKVRLKFRTAKAFEERLTNECPINDELEIGV